MRGCCLPRHSAGDNRTKAGSDRRVVCEKLNGADGIKEHGRLRREVAVEPSGSERDTMEQMGSAT
jgi:hypothetical protein